MERSFNINVDFPIGYPFFCCDKMQLEIRDCIILLWRMMQSEESGIYVNNHWAQILDFADDLNILGDSLEGVLELTTVLERAAAKSGLRVNVEKPKYWSFLIEI